MIRNPGTLMTYRQRCAQLQSASAERVNTCLQVKHSATEQVNPGLEIVALMMHQGINKRGLQLVEFPDVDWLRVESCVITGTVFTPHFEPSACKLIATSSTRAEAFERPSDTLAKRKIYGPPNIAYLRACSTLIATSSTRAEAFERPSDTLAKRKIYGPPNIAYLRAAFRVQSGGVETTVQDYPTVRSVSASRAAAQDDARWLSPPLPLSCRRRHLRSSGEVNDRRDRRPDVEADVGLLAASSLFAVETIQGAGMRAYLAVRGGFPGIPKYLGFKATSMCLRGYQDRPLTAEDHIAGPLPFSLPSEHTPPRDRSEKAEVSSGSGGRSRRPTLQREKRARLTASEGIRTFRGYPSHRTIRVLPDLQCDPMFIVSKGLSDFFAIRWTVSPASDRVGVRLERALMLVSMLLNLVQGDHLIVRDPSLSWPSFHLRMYDRVGFPLGAVHTHTRPSMSGASVRAAQAAAPACPRDPIDLRLHAVRADPATERPAVALRQTGYWAISLEFGEMSLDFAIRPRAVPSV
ncbi:hypothetical protein C8Q76DRAFT_791301 [Earliella scabrosa]|nr:hypothetical protein C8Q76DRAFT_791301 [Earliella scabrosa]